MERTGWHYDEFEDDTIANLYSRFRFNFNKRKLRFSFFIKPLPPFTLITYPDGGALTNVNNLHRFLKANMSLHPEYISPEYRDKMFAKQFNYKTLPDELKKVKGNQGLFWRHTMKGSPGHTGGDPGITTLAFIRKDNIGIIAFINTDESIMNKKKLKLLVSILHNFSPKKQK